MWNLLLLYEASTVGINTFPAELTMFAEWAGENCYISDGIGGILNFFWPTVELMCITLRIITIPKV